MLLYKWIWIRCWYDLVICLSKILMWVNWLDARKLFKFLCLTVLSAKLCCTPILHYLNYMHLKVGLIDGSWYFIKDSYVESFISVFIESYFCNFSSFAMFFYELRREMTFLAKFQSFLPSRRFCTSRTESKSLRVILSFSRGGCGHYFLQSLLDSYYVFLVEVYLK